MKKTAHPPKKSPIHFEQVPVEAVPKMALDVPLKPVKAVAKAKE